ncbi:MAG TPA: polysaccharide pyruvyl transferase family protein [Terriglobales bacterium]|jgi:polysaccharide pyruvyl transferase WcaK-like protein|nr:polysaccharide pyruvyl transferase family protein [Terriglobales bacterium]
MNTNLSASDATQNQSSVDESSKKIGLLFLMGGGNLGDDATQDGMIASIKKRWPSATIWAFSMNPEYTLGRYGIPSYPISRHGWKFGNKVDSTKVSFKDKAKSAAGKYQPIFTVLKAIKKVALGLPRAFLGELSLFVNSFLAVRKLDILVISGGGQLVESSGSVWSLSAGPWKFPCTVFKWVLLARLNGVRRVVFNVGAGPLAHTISRSFVRGTLSLSDYSSVRDEESRTLLKQIGVKGNLPVFPDSAYTLKIPVQVLACAGSETKSVVGLAPMALGDPRRSSEHDRISSDVLTRRLGAFSSWLIDKEYDVTLFCSDIAADPPFIAELERMLAPLTEDIGRRTTAPFRRVHQWTVEELLGNMARMDYIVASRFHTIVLAHILNKPVLAISAHPKVTSLMNDLGLAQYCVDVADCELAVLTDKFHALVRDREAIEDRMAARLENYRARLSEQFDELFSPAMMQYASR